MTVIIQLQYSLADTRVFHDVKNITQSSLHPTQPNPPKIKKTLTQSNPTQPMDGPNPWPTLAIASDDDHDDDDNDDDDDDDDDDVTMPHM